ncbi:transposase [Pontibacterium sp.]|uniref:REP-associated tyrosine transposase n=1 Tax=Pontibacterium sp. TaxID=2036026 RepID=UPI0035156A22
MRYRRSDVAGGTYFFTVNLQNRNQTTLVDEIDLLRSVFLTTKAKHPFKIDAMVVLPEHLHCIWTLPPDDSDFSIRWRVIKAAFSRGIAKLNPVNESQYRRRERGIWQRRYWEHLIRDDNDFARHVDYIHFNPVKHGYANRASDWPYSSIHRYIRSGDIDPDWGVSSDFVGKFGER